MIDPGLWRQRRVLVTGHTGFKGSWLTLWLKRLEAEVYGLALPPATEPNLFEMAGVATGVQSDMQDLRDPAGTAERIRACHPEVVFHLAAQPLVRASYREPLATYATNVMGTAHMLQALRGLDSVRVVVIITTDKVYRNLQDSYPYRESDPLGGHDPYSASKAASEIVIASYRDAFLREQGVAVASARAGNVIGGGDWSEDRLIPDAVRAWQAGEPLVVRRPSAVRPWQHVLEPLHGYLVLAQRLWRDPEAAGAFNFGPPTHEAATVRQVVERVREIHVGGEVTWGDGSEGPHEAGWLALEVAKARAALGWSPRWTLEQALVRTLRWYRAVDEGGDARSLCLADIEAYGQ